jgi:hypothetical protein
MSSSYSQISRVLLDFITGLCNSARPSGAVPFIKRLVCRRNLAYKLSKLEPHLLLHGEANVDCFLQKLSILAGLVVDLKRLQRRQVGLNRRK